MWSSYIKQYGIQRSGTNILKILLEANFHTRVLNLVLGSKHEKFSPEALKDWSPPVPIEELGLEPGELDAIMSRATEGALGCTLIIKRPLPWLVSLNRYRAGKSASPLPFDQGYVEQWLPRWVEMNQHWLTALPEAFGEKLVISSYDSLLQDPESLLLAHEEKLGLRRRFPKLVLRMPAAASAGSDKQYGLKGLTQNPFDREYYSSSAYLNSYTPEMLDSARKILDAVSGPLRPYVDPDM